MNLANKITLIRICLIPVFIVVYLQYPVWLVEQYPFLSKVNEYGVYWAVAIFIIASATDKLDGYIARKFNLVTNFGKLLDPLADKLLVSVALIMMVEQHVIPSWIAVTIIGREIFVSAIRILSASKGVALAADKHGKLKLVLQVSGIAAVLMGDYPFAFVTDFPVDYTIMLLAVLLTVYSGFSYMKNNYKQLQLKI